MKFKGYTTRRGDGVGRDSINWCAWRNYIFSTNNFDNKNWLKAMAGLSTALIFFTMAITGYTMAEFIRIERDRTFDNEDFLLPDSHCPAGQQQCGNFSGNSLAVCWCYCRNLQGRAATFYESSYSCLPVSDVRQQAGMTVIQLLLSYVVCWVTIFWVILDTYKTTSNRRKPENNCLLRLKNTKEIIINHKGTRMVKDGEDKMDLQTTNLKNLDMETVT